MSIIMPAMMDRREFFGRACALALAPAVARHSGIGQVRYCRASSTRWLAVARRICGERNLIAEVHPSTETGFALLGSEGTMVFDRTGWRVLP